MGYDYVMEVLVVVYRNTKEGTETESVPMLESCTGFFQDLRDNIFPRSEFAA